MADGSQKPGNGKSARPRTVRAWTAARPDQRGAAPLPLGQVLVSAEQFALRESGAYMSQTEWRSIVGERIAGNTRVGTMRHGTLTVKVASSAWSAELAFLKSDLLGRLARAGRDVKDLRFLVHRDGPAPTRRRFPDAKKPEAPAPVELPPELEARLRLVEDPNLRAAIAEAARHSFRTTKK